MAPTLDDGDMILVDRRIQELRGSAVYMIQNAGDLGWKEDVRTALTRF